MQYRFGVYDRRREQRRQKYDVDADDDAVTTVPDNEVDVTSTPAYQRLISDRDDDQLNHITTSSSQYRVEGPRDAPVVWNDRRLLPPPPPRPSRCRLPSATARREFMETSF